MPRYHDWYDNSFFPPSLPLPAQGGIKSQSKRGTFGESWWSKRWIAVLESFNIGARLMRGRSYARNGQVLDIVVEEGQVRAKVQGSRPKPYSITMRVQTLTADDWERVVQAISEEALAAANLLNGIMPPDIERVFQVTKTSLFPARLDEIETNCSCPDWSNPCKHIAAVYYLLGEEFDRDPFLLFTLRGMARSTLLARLAEQHSDHTTAANAVAAEAVVPLSTDPVLFWQGAPPIETIEAREVRVPVVAAALPKRLGAFPFWRGERLFIDALEEMYAYASKYVASEKAGV